MMDAFDLSQFKAQPTAAEQALTDEEYWASRQSHIKDTGTERAWLEGGGPFDKVAWIVSRAAGEIILHGALADQDHFWIDGHESFKGAYIYRRTERKHLDHTDPTDQKPHGHWTGDVLPVFEYVGPTDHPTEVPTEVKRIIVPGA